MYFDSTSTSAMCVLSFVCGVSCQSTSSSSNYGQFSYVLVGSSPDCYNYVHQSTISNCAGNSESRATLRHYYGNINLRTVNLSHNTCTYWSAFGLLYASAAQNDVSFSSFRDNTATSWICLHFYSGTFNLKSSNIIENEQQDSRWGTVCTEGTSSTKLTVNECCLVGNTGGKLFYAYSGSISGSNNYVDLGTQSIGVNVGTVNNQFINQIPCLKTEECDADYDQWSNLDPKTYEDLTYDAGDEQSSKKTICHVTCISRCRSLRLDVLVFTIFTT